MGNNGTVPRKSLSHDAVGVLRAEFFIPKSLGFTVF